MGIDSGVLTMTNFQDKFKHERNVTRFNFGGLTLTLRSRVCLNSKALKMFVVNQKIVRKKKLGKDKASQSSGPNSQEAKSGSMNPQDFWEKLIRSAKPEDAKLEEILESMTLGDKCILFVIAGACEVNNMVSFAHAILHLLADAHFRSFNRFLKGRARITRRRCRTSSRM